MRGTIDGLGTPFPVGQTLPAILQEDDFLQRMTAGLDEVLAPLFDTLDCLDSYFDPALTPPDFLRWLAGWVGVELDETWPIERRRQLVTEMVSLYRKRGTVEGISRLVEIYTGTVPEVVDSGAAAFSEVPGGALPGASSPQLVVRLRGAQPGRVDLRRLDQLVAANKPAHVAHRVEVVEG